MRRKDFTVPILSIFKEENDESGNYVAYYKEMYLYHHGAFHDNITKLAVYNIILKMISTGNLT
jgi:hypothetical protein